MPKHTGSRSISSLPTLTYRRPLRVSLTSGTGSLHAAAASTRLKRVEALLESLEAALDFQFARTASLQAEVDDLKARLRAKL